MQQKPFHVKSQVKYDLGLCWIYSQAFRNIENTIQRSMGKAVVVHKNPNIFTKGPILSIFMSMGDPFL